MVNVEKPDKPVLEIRGFGKLIDVFRGRKWTFPLLLPIAQPLSGSSLLEELDIARQQVEALLVNGRVQTFDKLIQPGDRVALIPPGTPGPYRILLGFVDRK